MLSDIVAKLWQICQVGKQIVFLKARRIQVLFAFFIHRIRLRLPFDFCVTCILGFLSHCLVHRSFRCVNFIFNSSILCRIAIHAFMSGLFLSKISLQVSNSFRVSSPRVFGVLLVCFIEYYSSSLYLFRRCHIQLYFFIFGSICVNSCSLQGFGLFSGCSILSWTLFCRHFERISISLLRGTWCWC